MKYWRNVVGHNFCNVQLQQLGGTEISYREAAIMSLHESSDMALGGCVQIALPSRGGNL